MSSRIIDEDSYGPIEHYPNGLPDEVARQKGAALIEALRQSTKEWDAMTPEAREAMLKAQRESYIRSFIAPESTRVRIIEG